jgi:hypothetical protein
MHLPAYVLQLADSGLASLLRMRTEKEPQLREPGLSLEVAGDQFDCPAERPVEQQ